MLKFNFTFLLLLIILNPIVIAYTTSYESSSVGRIVGENPEELSKQLEPKHLDLKHASYYIYDANTLAPGVPLSEQSDEDKKDLIRAQFVLQNYVKSNFKWSDITSSSDQWQNNEYLLIDTIRDKDYSGTGSELELSEARKWLKDIQRTNPLMVLSADYAGQYLPKERSIVQELGQDAITVTTNAYSSPHFVHSFICNMERYGVIGDAYKNARNQYYAGPYSRVSTGRNQNGAEKPGVGLISFQLFGNPLSSYETPNDALLEKRDFCKSIDELSYTSSFVTQAVQENTFKNTVVFNVENAGVRSDNDFDYITSTNMYLTNDYLELMLPKTVITHELPLDTVVEEIELVELSDPIEFSANIPTWFNEPVGRICEKNTKEAGIDYSHAYDVDRELVFVEIDPVEVIDCEAGEFRIYQKISYGLNYIPRSDVLIKSIDVPGSAKRLSNIEALIELQNIKSYGVNGEIKIKLGGQEIATHPASFLSQENRVELVTFTTPDEYGIKQLVFEYYDSADKLRYKTTKVINIEDINIDLQSPSKVNQGEELIVTAYVRNNLDPFTLGQTMTGVYEIKGEDYGIINEISNVLIKQGDNTLQFPIDTSEFPYGDFTFELFISDDGTQHSDHVNFQIVDSNPQAPVINDLPDLQIYEGERVEINPTATDPNGDALEFIFELPFNENGEWQTGNDDVGSYQIRVGVTDGDFSDSTTFNLDVVEKRIVNDFDGDTEVSAQFNGPYDKQVFYLKILKSASFTSGTVDMGVQND